LSSLKHIIGCGGILVALDGLFFDGFCTKIFDPILSLASNQIAPQLRHFSFSLSQFIHSYI